MRLQSIGEALWLAEGDVVSFYGFPYPTRMLVARFPDHRLWVWSPIALDKALRDEVDALGTVGWLVAPNPLHHLYLAEWRQSFPEATLHAPRSVAKKRSDLEFDSILEDEPLPEWAPELDQAWFRGSLLMDEIVFFHRRSRTAIFADLTENFEPGFLERHWSRWQRWIARLWGITTARGYAPLEWRLSFFRREPARRALDKVLAWDPEQVVMAHGRREPAGGRAYLERAFAWLREGRRHA